MNGCGAVEGLGRCAAEHAVNHRLAAHTHEQGHPEFVKTFQVLQHIVVVFKGLSETESGVSDDVVHAVVAEHLCTPRQICHHIGRHIVVVRRRLHVAGLALHVHKNVGYAKAADGVEHGTVHLSAGNVVDNLHAEVADTHPCHVGSESVDADDGIGGFTAYHLQACCQAVHLLVGAYLVRSRTCAARTDIDDGAALVENLTGTLADAFGIGISIGGFRQHTAAGEEGIGGEVEDSHDHRARQAQQASADIDGIFHDGCLLDRQFLF